MTDESGQERYEDSLRAAEYALGLLPAEETAAFERRLAVDPRLRAHYAAWAEDFAQLTDGIPETAPPPGLWRNIEAELFPEARQGFLRRIGLFPALAGGLVAALLVVLVGNETLFAPPPPLDPVYRADVVAEDGSMLINARYTEGDRRLVLDKRMGQPPEGRVLELWLIPEGQGAISLGILPNDDGEAEVIVPEELVAFLDGGLLAITDEPPGGAPGGVATGQVLAAGTLGSV